MTESKNPYRSVKRQKKSGETEQDWFPHWLYENGALDKELAAEYIAKRDAFIEKIRATFPADQHPGKDNIGRGYDEDYILDLEFLPTFKKSWEEISLDTAKKYSWDFFYKFNATGRVYFLPLFLICTLLHPDEMDGVFMHLVPYSADYWWKHTSGFMDERQKHIMVEFCQFLEFMGYEGYDTEANIKFWQEALQGK